MNYFTVIGLICKNPDIWLKVRMKSLKVKLKVTGAQPGMFQGRTGFLEWKHFDKQFMHDIQKKGSAGKNFLVFSSRYS